MKRAGAHRVCIETYGCSANRAESEMMAGVLSEAGFRLSREIHSADVVVVNTCFVKTPTEQKIIRRVSDMAAEYPGKKIIIAGCMPAVLSKKLSRLLPLAGLVSTQNAGRIAEAVRTSLSGERPVFISGRGQEKPLLPRVRINGLIGIIPISEGCSGACTYCSVRLAKGALSCYPPGEIIEAARRAVASGCRELWMTSQDNASYSCGGVRLPELVKRVCAIQGNFMVRIGMMNPDGAAKMMDGLIGTYRNPKVYRFAHLPLQSGSARVLKLMGRMYGPQDFLSLVATLRSEVQGITIATDVIAGFPGETDADFRQTLGILEETTPDVTNVSKFGPRPGTEAARMAQLDGRVVKARSAEASALARRIALGRNAAWKGWKGRALFTERGRKNGQYMGRNPAYKQVVVSCTRNLLGKEADVEIAGASVTHLKGTPA